ncbi:MAG: MmgE/PrpD family protein [Pigmentiphaga sp.]|nr:MmgE/PrpD family protein [Pigmentiphaga sp.]
MSSKIPAASGSLLESLAESTTHHVLDQLPGFVVREAKLCLLDTLGCILAGTRTPESALILSSASHVRGEYAVLGVANKRLDRRHATLINGYHGDILELNDLIGGHASIGNVTAALSLIQEDAVPGGVLIEALVSGLEVTWRIYSAVYPQLKPFGESGLVPVGIPSAFGAAAVASRLWRLPPPTLAHALAIAGATAGWCPAEVIFGHGGTMKPLLFGAQPAVTGIEASHYAKLGMTGPLQLLESPVGYFRTTAREGQAVELPSESRWGLEQPRRKLHACCGYIHSAVDALGILRREWVDAPSPARISISLPPYVAEVISKSRLPLSANDARFHLQYCLALVMAGYDVIEPHHILDFQRYLAEPAVAQALEIFRVLADGSLEHYQSCKVTALNRQGAIEHELAFDTPRGSPSRPLSEQDLIQKFLRLSQAVLTPSQADEVADLVLRLETLEDSRGILAPILAMKTPALV